MRIYNVGPKGSGKTPWLMKKAKEENDIGNTVVFLGSADKFNKLCEYYITTYHEHCPVRYVKDCNSIPHGAVVLSDNLVEWSTRTLVYTVDRRATRWYITLEGLTDYTPIDHQLNIDELLEGKNESNT